MKKGNILFGWEDLIAGQPLKKLTAAFDAAGATIVSSSSDGKAKRTAGVSYKTLDIAFADSQQIELQVKQTGDVFQVKLNGQVVPLKNPDDHKAAIKELVAKMDAGRAKFQKKLTMVRAELPKGTKSVAPQKTVALAARVSELDTAIAGATAKRDALKAEVGVMDSAALDAAKQKDSYMAFNVDSAMGKFTVIVKTEKGAAELDAIRDAREAVKSELHGLGSTQVIPGGKVMKSIPADAWDAKSAKGWAWMIKGNFSALDSAALDAAKQKLGVGDDVHNKKLNKTGSVRKVEGDKVLVRTVSGLDTWDLADVEVVATDSIDDDAVLDGITGEQRKVFVGYAIEIVKNIKAKFPDADPKQIKNTLFKVMSNMVLTDTNPNYVNTKNLMPDSYDKDLFTKDGLQSLWPSMNDSHQDTVFNQALKKAGVDTAGLKAMFDNATFDRVSYEQAKSFVFAHAVKKDGTKVDLVLLDGRINELTEKGAATAELEKPASRKDAMRVAKESGNYKSVTEGGTVMDGAHDYSDEELAEMQGWFNGLPKASQDRVMSGEIMIDKKSGYRASAPGGKLRITTLDSAELDSVFINPLRSNEQVLDGAGNNSTDLDNPAYTTAVKLPGQGKVTAINAHSAADGAKILNKIRPDWTKADHLNMAAKHEDLAESAETDWGDLVSSEFKKLFGRDYRVGDYKVSGVARSEFSDDVKDKLRELNRQMNEHKSLRVAHAYAAKHYGKSSAALDYAGQPRDTNGQYATGKQGSLKAKAQHVRFAVKRAFSNPFRK